MTERFPFRVQNIEQAQIEAETLNTLVDHGNIDTRQLSAAFPGVVNDLLADHRNFQEELALQQKENDLQQDKTLQGRINLAKHFTSKQLEEARAALIPLTSDEYIDSVPRHVLELAIALVAAAPVAAVCVPIALINCLKEKALFYNHGRLMKNGTTFRMCKFQSMKTGSSEIDDETSKKLDEGGIDNDTRVTDFGKTLRKTNLDELPQMLQFLASKLWLVRAKLHLFGRRATSPRAMARMRHELESLRAAAVHAENDAEAAALTIQAEETYEWMKEYFKHDPAVFPPEALTRGYSKSDLDKVGPQNRFMRDLSLKKEAGFFLQASLHMLGGIVGINRQQQPQKAEKQTVQEAGQMASD